MNQLYVVTVVFNPRRFRSRIRLYNEFSRWVAESGVQLLTVEIAFGDRPFEVTQPDNRWNLQLRTNYELWHKERALNLGLRHLQSIAPHWKYVAWMDADIRLARPDWPHETVHLLHHYAIVQMFGEARSLGPNHETIYYTRSIASNFEKHGKVDWYTNPGIKETDPYIRAGHPGLAWAFRRDELNGIGGWLDCCVNGSGDLHMVGCFAGDWTLAGISKAPAGYRSCIHRYGELCDRYVRRNMGYMPGSCDHYWHGRSGDRGYEDRGRLIRKYQFNPHTDLITDVHGLWKWNLADPRVMDMAIEVRKSLAGRNEDVNEI